MVSKNIKYEERSKITCTFAVVSTSVDFKKNVCYDKSEHSFNNIR